MISGICCLVALTSRARVVHAANRLRCQLREPGWPVFAVAWIGACPLGGMDGVAHQVYAQGVQGAAGKPGADPADLLAAPGVGLHRDQARTLEPIAWVR